MYIAELTCPHCLGTEIETVANLGVDTGELYCSSCGSMFSLLDALNPEDVLAEDIAAEQARIDQQLEDARYELLFAELDQQILSTNNYAHVC